jgi:hypothetical protein
MSRRLKLALVAVAVLAFLLVSAGLARILSANNAERAEIADLMAAQARGDAAGVARLLRGCAADHACVARQRAITARVRRPGDVKLALLQPSSRFLLGGARGLTRVAWSVVGTQTTRVQCVGVQRTGNVLQGMGVVLTSLSAPIPGDRDCPGQG